MKILRELRVAAEQTVVPEYPEITGAGDGILRRVGDVVLVVAGAGEVLPPEQAVELVILEAREGEVEAVERRSSSSRPRSRSSHSAFSLARLSMRR